MGFTDEDWMAVEWQSANVVADADRINSGELSGCKTVGGEPSRAEGPDDLAG